MRSMSLPGLEKSLSFKSKTSKELSDAEVEINESLGEQDTRGVIPSTGGFSGPKNFLAR